MRYDTLHSPCRRPSFPISPTAHSPQPTAHGKPFFPSDAIVGPAFETTSSSIMVRQFLISFLFIMHAPPLRYFDRCPFHSPSGDMTTMVEANKYWRSCFFVAVVLAGICGGVVVSEMLCVIFQSYFRLSFVLPLSNIFIAAHFIHRQEII